MKIKKIRVVPFGLKRKIIELQDVTISTIEEKKMATGENQLWILDKDGYNVSYAFNDCRLQSITKELMTLMGYTTVKCEKVLIYVWV
jgi:hypothetical protein